MAAAVLRGTAADQGRRRNLERQTRRRDGAAPVYAGVSDPYEVGPDTGNTPECRGAGDTVRVAAPRRSRWAVTGADTPRRYWSAMSAHPSDALLASLLAAVEAAPDDVPLRLHVAELLLGRGRGAEALQHCSRALAKAPADPAAIALLQRVTAALAGPPT